MKALILNSGKGTRMGNLTKDGPKCLVKLYDNTTILERQLSILEKYGISDIILTTGQYDKEIREVCSNYSSLKFTFVFNELYDTTNYIYSIYKSKDCLDDDILLLHGDLIFEEYVILRLLNSENSCVAVNSHQTNPNKDFKADVCDGRVSKISVEPRYGSVSSQPAYKLNKTDMGTWLDKISEYCESGNTSSYAEEALNDVLDSIEMMPINLENIVCMEIDNLEDLSMANGMLMKLPGRKVYLSISSDVIHDGHINIIQYAASLGELTVGIMSDEAIATYKHYPILPFEKKRKIISNIKGVSRTIMQEKLSYEEVITKLKPDIVVHGDEWRHGVLSPIRIEVIELLDKYGGLLIEPPYTKGQEHGILENKIKEELSIPENRRASLKKLLKLKKCIRVMEAHNGLTGLIVEKTKVAHNGEIRQFDAMWISSLCDSTAKGKPDIELVDMTSRMDTINEILEVTTKPIILDGDTGGILEHFLFNVKTLERSGVSAIIIEDKIGLKKNSLFGTEVPQMQDDPDNFAMKISAGKKAQLSKDFMIIARIESLILEKGMDDALMRAKKYVTAGADGIMIHSKKKDPAEIFEFIERFRGLDSITPLVVVPTSYNHVKEDEFKERGANIVIYANHLIRAAFPAMQSVAESILKNQRSLEVDEDCLSIKEIITLIPDE